LKSLSKDKYGFAVALLAAILAFSTFKDGLQSAHVSLVTFHTDLFVIAIWFTALLSISAYFFALDFLRIGTKYESSKLLSVAVVLADASYFISMLLPIGVVVIWGITEAVKACLMIAGLLNVEASAAVTSAFNFAMGLLGGVISVTLGTFYARYRRNVRLRNKLTALKSERYAQLENVERLYKQGFYNSMVIEAYILIKMSIRELLAAQEQPTYGKSTLELAALARKRNLLSKQDEAVIKDLRALRNEAAHRVVSYSEKQANIALKAVRRIFETSSKEDKN